MSYYPNKRPSSELDDRANKSYRSDHASDASSHRYQDTSSSSSISQRADDRTRPQPSSASTTSRPTTSGFIHPDRLNPSASATSSSSSHGPPPSSAPYSSRHSSYQSNSTSYNNSSSYNSSRGGGNVGYGSDRWSNSQHNDTRNGGGGYPPRTNGGYQPSSTTTSQSQSKPSASTTSSNTAAPRPSSTTTHNNSSTSRSSTSSTTSAPSNASLVASVQQSLLEKERLAEIEFQKKMEAKMAELAEEEEKTEEQLAAERAAKRAAILAKFNMKEEAPPVVVVPIPNEPPEESKEPETNGHVKAETLAAAPSVKSETDVVMQDISPPPTSTAVAPASSSTADSSTAAAASSSSKPISIDSYDMFSDSTLAPEVEAGLEGNRDLASGGVGEMLDSYDDHEGYYRYRLGDLLEGGRYRVTGLQGSGVFSTVLRVKELIPGQAGAPSTEGRDLVVKLIRSNETMFQAGQKELEYLKILSANDPENKKHCVKLFHSFMHRNHLCLVFEPLNMDLRKVIKKFGSVGLNLRAVRSYAKQLMIALRHLKKCMILHGDIKPDNILVNESMNIVKICDFGSAGKLDTGTCEITPYLVSRFYRAPEIILGLKYDQQVDLWSIGVCLYELYTGKILFSGHDNNSMLKAIQDVKGRFPKKMLQRGQFTAQHFDHELVFEWKKVDSVTKQEMRQKIRYEKPVKDLYHLLRTQNTGEKPTVKEVVKLKQLAEFIHQCLMLDPQQRPQCEELLQHPFITEDF